MGPTPEPVAGPAVPLRVEVEPVVEAVRVLALESFPVQAFAQVTGYLPDPTAEIDRVGQSRSGNLIAITLSASRPAAAVSATGLVAFERRVPLEIEGLPAGRYGVVVNGVSGELVLERDNGPAPAGPGGVGGDGPLLPNPSGI